MTNRFIFPTLFFLLLFFDLVFSQANNYLWPTDASRLMTSSFCEFRPRHYHAAIDIKTWGRTGYKAFAVTEGYVVRVRVSAFGYGKAVYLKLKDGNIAVYGHLQRFSPALEKYVDRIRLRNHQYRVDLNLKPDQFPVKRGQIIGYTGKTGIGVPHLHFEMRNAKNEPINPFPFYSQIIKDDIPPQIYQAALIPLNYKGLIDLKPDTIFYSFKKNSKVVLPDTLFLTGKIGLLLKIFDHADGASNRFSFHQAKMTIDGERVYYIQYNRFSYAETALIELDKNFSLWRKGQGIFHNFFRHPANTLSFYDGTPPGGGIINSEKLTDGLHHLQITVFDFQGNRAEFQMDFISGQPANIQPDIFQTINNDYFVRLQSPEKIEKVKFFSDLSGKWIPLDKYELNSELSLGNRYYYTLSMKADSATENHHLQLQAKTDSGIPTFPIFLGNSNQSLQYGDSPKFEIQNYRMKKDWIEISTRVPSKYAYKVLPKLQAKLSDILWFQVAPNRFHIHVPLKILQANSEIFRAMFAEGIPKAVLVDPHGTSRAESDDRLFAAEFSPGSLYEKTAVFLNTFRTIPEQFAFEPPYRSIGNLYQLEPFDQPVHQGVQISLSVPEFERKAPGLGIYYRDRKKGWLFLPSRWDSSRSLFTARVTSLELFTLGQDTIPPVVLPASRIKGGLLFSKNGSLTFLLKDEKSGISKESQIKVYLNNKWHLFEYDPEEDLLKIKLPSGNKTPRLLRITVTDNVGNRREQSYRVR